jgi:flagellar P-ring protein precursor FlgI
MKHFIRFGWLIYLIGMAGLRVQADAVPAADTVPAVADPLDPQRAGKPKTRPNPDTQTRPTPETSAPPRPATKPGGTLDTDMSFTPGTVRIKDIARVQGVRGNQLVGFGLVVGLEGTGDGQLSIFTVQGVLNMLRRFGVSLNISPQQLQIKNVAAVMVTANLPPFAKQGTEIDVTLASIGDARSLQGGVLLQTPLRGGDGEIYAVAQGPITIGGLNISAGGSTVQRNFVNVGRIPRGAIIEQEVPTTLSDGATLQITLNEPDFTTASRVAQALKREGIVASASDASTITLPIPPDRKDDLIEFLAQIEIVAVTPDMQAKVVINERTGTIVVGGNVRLIPGAVAHGSINIRIDPTPVVVPPSPFNPNPGFVVPFANVTVKEPKAQLFPIPATTTIEQLIRALNALGVTTRDLIAILQNMQRAGLLSAQLEVI